MKNKVKIIGNIFYWTLILVIVIFAVGTTFSIIEVPKFRYKLFEVQSGSMEPKIKVGSIVFVAPQKEYQQNDIITVTHRINEIKVEGEDTFYITKGDANEDPDTGFVSKERVLGKVIFILPLFGYIVSFTKTQAGFILLIIIPAVLLIYHEILNIRSETGKIIKKKKEEKQNNKSEVIKEQEKNIIKTEDKKTSTQKLNHNTKLKKQKVKTKEKKSVQEKI